MDPEITFYEFSQEVPLRYSKHGEEGLRERRELLEARVDGTDRILEAQIARVSLAHLVDSAAWSIQRQACGAPDAS